MQSLRYGLGDYECHECAAIFALKCLYSSNHRDVIFFLPYSYAYWNNGRQFRKFRAYQDSTVRPVYSENSTPFHSSPVSLSCQQKNDWRIFTRGSSGDHFQGYCVVRESKKITVDFRDWLCEIVNLISWRLRSAFGRITLSWSPSTPPFSCAPCNVTKGFDAVRRVDVGPI